MPRKCRSQDFPLCDRERLHLFRLFFASGGARGGRVGWPPPKCLTGPPPNSSRTEEKIRGGVQNERLRHKPRNQQQRNYLSVWMNTYWTRNATCSYCWRCHGDSAHLHQNVCLVSFFLSVLTNINISSEMSVFKASCTCQQFSESDPANPVPKDNHIPPLRHPWAHSTDRSSHSRPVSDVTSYADYLNTLCYNPTDTHYRKRPNYFLSILEGP